MIMQAKEAYLSEAINGLLANQAISRQDTELESYTAKAVTEFK